MKKSTLLTAIAVLGLLTTGCSQDQNSPTPSGNGTIKYEVISSNAWDGNYDTPDGSYQVQNKQSGWTYSFVPHKLPYGTFLEAYPHYTNPGDSTNIILRVYYNDQIVATDSAKLDCCHVNLRYTVR